jgi:sugar lactone lactonase YvrE
LETRDLKHEIEVVADDGNVAGEGPTWVPEGERLVWNDLESSLVYELVTATGARKIISRELMVAGIARNHDGRFVFAGSTGLHIWRGQDDYRTILANHNGEELFFNDIIADPAGRVYAGTLYWDVEANAVEKPGKLYLLDTDESVRVVAEGFEHVNGMGFSCDNKTLYFTDTLVRKIYAYDVDPDSGDLSNKRVLVQVPDDEGIPDGLTVDAEDHIWSAQWYGGQVVRYDPDGKVRERIAFPVKQTSSVIFGGPNLTDLYVTSAADYWVSSYIPTGFDKNAAMGGSLYRVRTDIAGKPEYQAGFVH